MMKKIVKWVLIAVIAIGAVAGGIYYINMPLAVVAVQALPKTAELYFTEQGVADVDRTVDVYSITAGKINTINVKENQSVHEGDVLCIIASDDLVFQIAQAENNIKGYYAQINNLKTEERRSRESLITNKNSLLGELRALEAQESTSLESESEQVIQRDEQVRLQKIIIEQNQNELKRARDDLSKAEVLLTAGGISESDYNLLMDRAANYEALLEQNLLQLQIIENGNIISSETYYTAAKESILAQIAGIDSTLASSYTAAMEDYYNSLIESCLVTISQLNKRIEDCNVTSPVSGVITTLYIKNTNMVTGQTPVAVITPDTSSQIETYVSTSDIDEIYIGQQVDIILKRRSGDKIYKGEIALIDDEASVKYSVLGVEERRIKVTVTPLTGTEDIKKGFDADIKFIIYREENKITVPKTAFFKINDKDMVWVVRNGTAQIIEVVKGRELRTEYIVDSGLEPGDWVISDANIDTLKEGLKVTVE